MTNNFSSADFINKTNELILSGFNFPDKDGFKNTVERNEAILNNTFSKSSLVKTLTEISDNNTSKLKTSNSDTVNFFKWSSSFNNLYKVPNKDYCEFSIPISQFISPKERNLFKIKQFYRKWITLDDLYENWETFKSIVLVFVNSKIYSEYSFWVDDQEVLVRFKYTQNWVNSNPMITIYKFETEFQKRIKISKYQMTTEWNWKLPFSYINDSKILNYSNLICYTNKISDLNIRKENKSIVEIIGYNLEFINLNDNYIDCSKFSEKTKSIIKSERSEYLYLSLIVPKNFFEFPLLLPVDYVNQFHVYDLKKVFSYENTLNEEKEVKSNLKQLFVDKAQIKDNGQRWLQMIRPLVLTDAFIEDSIDYDEFFEKIRELKKIIIDVSDLIEEFQTFVNYDYTEKGFDDFVIRVEKQFSILSQSYGNFLKYCQASLDLVFIDEYSKFLEILSDLKENRISSKWLSNKKISNEKFWFKIAPLIDIPSKLIENFYNRELVYSKKQKTVWEVPSDYKNKIRFSHPVDPSNIWIFEYDNKNFCWKPNFEVKVSYKYPDVYILELKEEELTNRIFKAFIFYTDLMNVREEVIDKVEPSADWEKDLKEFELEKFAHFRDIFIEKFYWIALKSVYKNSLKSNFRWELIELVFQNNYYEKFNQLFLETVDPYFRVSLINYLKGNLYNFPTESAINDFKKALQLQWNDFKKVTNFEIYLEKNWKPSYFDVKSKVSNDFINSRLVDNKVNLKFENIYDLDLSYEVFLNGKQFFDFEVLHENSVDNLFLNREVIEELNNPKLVIPVKNITVYKISGVDIIDPGAGYAEGQNIFVKKDNSLIKLEVTKIESNLKRLKEVSCSTEFDFDPSVETEVLSSAFENIDDEYGLDQYDLIEYPGKLKPMTFTYSIEDYWFREKRYDNLLKDDRNEKFQYQEITDAERFEDNGDPDLKWYLGTRVDNLQTNSFDMHKWNGFISLNPVTDSFINDEKRIIGSYRNEFQLFEVARFHLDLTEPEADLTVQNYQSLPRNISQWNQAFVDKKVKVLFDENYNKTMIYPVRGFLKDGSIIYNLPISGERLENSIEINWNNFDCYFDFPSLKALYSEANWSSIKFYKEIEEQISDGKITPTVKVKKINKTSYIDQIEIEDLAVFNWTTKEWEDLFDTDRWRFTRTENGFKIKFQEENVQEFSYLFKFYLIKSFNSQQRNYLLKRNAKIRLNSELVKTEVIPEKRVEVSVGNDLIVRKLFPYEFKKEFSLWYNNYTMEVTLPPYMHFRNQLFLEDIKVLNKSTGEFEDITDQTKFRVDFANDDAFEYGNELQTVVKNYRLLSRGKNFVNGTVWGWNEQYQIHLFGEVKADAETGAIVEFKLTHLSRKLDNNLEIEFELYQNINQTLSEKASVLVEFETSEKLIIENGFITGVSNPLAPLPETFRVFVLYALPRNKKYSYEISISKKRKEFILHKDQTQLFPEFQIMDSLNQDSLYIATKNGRLPLINPSTKKPTFVAEKNEAGTKIKFLNMYENGSELRVVSVPYTMRSVYTLRRIPEDGLIDLFGKLNKPLNKKYYEFWCNGKLLNEEVTIISPTKLVLHGLKSLKNFEIIEIDRDPNEFFSDSFLVKTENYLSRSYKVWNFDNYLDAVLDNRLPEKNFTQEERDLLTYPVYPQVNEESEDFKKYPLNQNLERDILVVDSEILSNQTVSYIYNLLVLNPPTINGIELISKDLSFEKLGFRPFSAEEISNELNEIWKEEIESNPYFNTHIVIDKDIWYGAIGKCFDENGLEVSNTEAVYSVLSDDLIYFDQKNKVVRILQKQKFYNFN